MTTLKLATWNVNSIRSRLTHVIDWLRAVRPDVLCLQETKVQDSEFPRDPLEELGYTVNIYGQKSYNGVAILSIVEPEQVDYGFPSSPPDPPRRLITAKIKGINVICVYIPNGESILSPKFEYKIEFLEHLDEHIRTIYQPSDPIILCGDFNIAPTDLDLHDPVGCRETVMFHSREHEFCTRWKTWGFIDVVRNNYPDKRDLYSWWDYRTGAFFRNKGWRIDHIWTTESLAKCCVAASIDINERGKDRPSDHAPVLAEFLLEKRE